MFFVFIALKAIQIPSLANTVTARNIKKNSYLIIVKHVI